MPLSDSLFAQFFTLGGDFLTYGTKNSSSLLLDNGIVLLLAAILVWAWLRRPLTLSRLTRRFALFLFVFSLLIRLLLLNDGLFHHDSIQAYNAVVGTLETGTLQPSVGGRYLFTLTNLLFYVPLNALLRNPDLTLNLITALEAAAAVTLLYLGLRRHLSSSPPSSSLSSPSSGA